MSEILNVVILGRPNVGKSTLFNRLSGMRRSLVHNLPGVTRDRIEFKTSWWVWGNEIKVRLVDTGGLKGGAFQEEIQTQVTLALQEAHLALFLFDGQTGLTSLDEELLRMLNRSGVTQKIPFISVVNKIDTEAHELRVCDFYKCSFSEIITLSAEHNRGIEDLKEAVVRLASVRQSFVPKKHDRLMESSSLPPNPTERPDDPDPVKPSSFQAQEDQAEERDEEKEQEKEPDEERALKKRHSVRLHNRVAIVGRPNVGKSTLFNGLLGQKRTITSPVAGTTIDTVDCEMKLSGKNFVFVDTAGIRRKNKTLSGVEVLSIVQTKKSLEKADVALLVLDAQEGVSDQDEKIAGLTQAVGCALILVVNKWDLQKQNPKFTQKKAEEQIRAQMSFLNYVPIIFLSALKEKGLKKIGPLLKEVLKQRHLKVSTHDFSTWMREVTRTQNPLNAKFYLSHQVSRHPPSFVCHVNDPKKIHFSMQRYLVNAIRERWGFLGSPVRLSFTGGTDRHVTK